MEGEAYNILIGLLLNADYFLRNNLETLMEILSLFI